jgi:hypothetical protein
MIIRMHNLKIPRLGRAKQVGDVRSHTHQVRSAQQYAAFVRPIFCGVLINYKRRQNWHTSPMDTKTQRLCRRFRRMALSSPSPPPPCPSAAFDQPATTGSPSSPSGDPSTHQPRSTLKPYAGPLSHRRLPSRELLARSSQNGRISTLPLRKGAPLLTVASPVHRQLPPPTLSTGKASPWQRTSSRSLVAIKVKARHHSLRKVSSQRSTEQPPREERSTSLMVDARRANQPRRDPPHQPLPESEGWCSP